MSKIVVSYDASIEIEQIIKDIESHLDLNKNETEIYNNIQKFLQNAFDDGRKFQKQLLTSSSVKDSVIMKTDIL